MNRSSLLMAILLAGVIGTQTGCDKTKEAVETAKQAASEVSGAVKDVTPETKDQASEKLDAYIKGYNALVSGWGIREVYEHVQENDYTKQEKTDSANFTENSSSIDRAIELFRKGQAIKAEGMEDMDKAVAEFIPLGEKLSAQQKELKPYFDSKKYQDDKLAKAKEAYPVMVANFAASIAALDKVSTLVAKYQRVESEKRIAKFKQSGDTLRYHTEEAMLDAQDLVALFDDPEKAIENPETYTKGDVALTKLEAVVEAQRKAYDEAKSKNAEHISSYDSIGDSLTSMIGAYRDLRTKKTPDAYNDLMKKYNTVIGNYNSAR